MKFHLVDRIESIVPGERIVTIKALSLAEEYLADHFPAFPVLPGVMMIEAMVQAAAWLVRVQQDFARSIVVLSAARNVKYARFVQPGEVLRCELTAMEIGQESARFKGAGFVGDRQAVSGRLELRCFDLAGRTAGGAAADEAIRAQLRQWFKLVGGPEALAAAGVA
ncbi:MAG TPA: 3-hydroxyacyl-ACP dehydratase FabZ family protein [Phycisphaerae bacterium]|nr:3-hydroxyacyl-ACP dehydratase FabZ family protein [Phycisphaerae bacterium]